MFNQLAFGFVIGSAVAGAFAQATTNIQAKTDSSAYVQDARGTIVRSPYGLCWRTGYWTPTDAVAGCDGQLAPPISKATAPAVPTAPPAPALPTATVTPKRCDFAVTLANDQTFLFNETALSNAAKRRIDADVINKLATCAKIEIVLVTGHTDRLGSQKYNQKLSEKRASAVAAYLKKQGVTAQVINTLGAGESQSIQSCDDKLARKKLIKCLAPDRRVVIEVRGLAK